MPQRVGPDRLGDPSAAGRPTNDPGGTVPVQPLPIWGEEDRPSTCSPTAKSIARAVRGAGGMVTTLPPLRVIIRVWCPRSTPSASTLAPVASETRSPSSASKETSTCPTGDPSPAATSSAPSSLRSSPVACDLFQLRTADVRGGRVLEQVFLEDVSVEPGS